MSIEIRVVPFSRSVRTLISIAAREETIKDLKDLRALHSRNCYRHAGPKGPEENTDTPQCLANGIGQRGLPKLRRRCTGGLQRSGRP